MPTPRAEKPLIPVCAKFFADDWEVFKEICGDGKANARLRSLMSQEIDRYTREEVRAQQLAGLTEA